MATKRQKASGDGATGAGTSGSATTTTTAIPKPLKPKKCASPKCGIKFTPTKEWQLYHSPTCSNRERGARERARYREMRKQLATAAGRGGRKAK